MMRTWLLNLFLLLFLGSSLLLNACAIVQRAGDGFSRVGWSSSDPLSIPYGTRCAQFEKGNLVSNPSFEKGRLTSSGVDKGFSLDGWHKVGSHVQWIQQPSGNMAVPEVNSGSHAVKIIRTRANEMDAAEGIISDYLPVIPGNYDFTFTIRLKDIASQKRRLGVKLYDALEIRVLFFDRNRQPLDADTLLPARDIRIDSSDKSFVFSHFWTIEDLPWSKVRGKAFTYPFSEGDVPDQTRFVKLFLGLKGTGIMWIDDIDYRYSKWNFTALERFQPYFARPLTLAEKITPTPKRFQQLSDVVYFKPGKPGAQSPLIVLPDNPAPAEINAASLLRAKLDKILIKIYPDAGPVSVTQRLPHNRLSPGEQSAPRLVLSIGRNVLYQQLQPHLPLQSIRNKRQGYIIKSKRVGMDHFVFLMGESPVGSFYAAATAAQLLESDSGIYHDACVIDYPDFLSRPFVLRKWRNNDELHRDLDNIGHMSRYKLNKAYVSPVTIRKIREQSAPVYFRGTREAGAKCTTGGVVNLAVMVNPYSHLGFFPSVEDLGEGDRFLWSHSDLESLALLKNIFKTGLDAGANTIMLLADDSVPHSGSNSQNYTLYTDADRDRFVSLQNAQAYIINQLKDWLDRTYPGTRLEFCPPWYANDFINRGEGRAEVYFKELAMQIPEDVAIVWTGPAVRSLAIDMVDIRRFKALIGRWPMAWDNTLYARSIASKHYGGYPAHYPGKVRMCNILEPFDGYRPESFHRYSSGGHIYINADAYRDTYKAKLATVADYLWNTSAYKPELSMWKVLCQTYGKACAKELLYFNDAYYGLYQICLRMEAEKTGNTFTDKGRTFIEAMSGSLQQIDDAACAGPTLVQELEGLGHRLKKRFEELALKQQDKS